VGRSGVEALGISNTLAMKKAVLSASGRSTWSTGSSDARRRWRRAVRRSRCWAGRRSTATPEPARRQRPTSLGCPCRGWGTPHRMPAPRAGLGCTCSSYADRYRRRNVVTTQVPRVGRQTLQRVRHELGKRRQPTSARERERGRVYNWQPRIGTHAGSCTSYQLRAPGQWRPAAADQPNSRRCSSCARAVKRVFLMHAGLQPTRPSSSAMATTPSIQGRG